MSSTSADGSFVPRGASALARARGAATALLLAAGFWSAGALAQNASDPKLVSTVLADPLTETTLSRNVGTATEYIGRGSFHVTLKNGAANALNRASFTAETSVLDASGNPIPTAVAAIDPLNGLNVIVVTGTPGCSIQSPTKLTCNFGDDQLVSGEIAEFYIVVKAPVAGAKVNLHWTFGGEEGNGGGNGCCMKVADTTLDLIDAAAANDTVNKHVQSFMVQNVHNKVFTGVNGGVASEADPWTTVAALGNTYTVATNPGQIWTQATVDEKLNDPLLGSCSALNKNQCWLSEVTIPNTNWTTANPLLITLERHSSIIKNGSKLSNYIIEYRPTGSSVFTQVPQCSLNPSLPALDAPCIEQCVEVPLTTKPSPFVWRCTVRAVNNGGYRTP